MGFLCACRVPDPTGFISNKRGTEMKKLPLLFTALFVMGSFTSAFAIDQTGKFAWGGTLGYSFGFGDAFIKYREYQHWCDYRTYEVNFSLGMKVKYGISSNFAIEGIIEGQSGSLTEKRGFLGYPVERRSYDWLNLLASVIFSLSPEEKVVPYLSGGVGLYAPEGKTGPLGNKMAEVGIHIGGGMEYFFKKNLSLDAGARFHKIFSATPSYTNFPADKNITYVNIYAGLNLYLEKK
jgi:opacity protein-like surface antigen